ncbi:hypothetical protein EVAR_24045_1 [Eumeta japonica]|uniref:Uncharacterized protein n=1 Tax=Eumeta variegata TaxID=151549 RepID=A0A4C1VV34_EUMVA|nr:hypothetical protein EVAR_24045_1 [Eumeta japonica]
MAYARTVYRGRRFGLLIETRPAAFNLNSLPETNKIAVLKQMLQEQPFSILEQKMAAVALVFVKCMQRALSVRVKGSPAPDQRIRRTRKCRDLPLRRAVKVCRRSRCGGRRTKTGADSKDYDRSFVTPLVIDTSPQPGYKLPICV